MQRPPPKPKAPDDLAEVERALSVLKGRNPEFERARREDEEKRAQRQAELDRAARAEAQKARARTVKLALAGVVVVGIAAFAGTGFRAEVARRGRVEQVTDPFRSMGFVVVETSGRGAPGRLEETPESGCLLAVSTGTAPLKITQPSGVIEGKGPVLFCTCQPAHVTVTAPDVGAAGGTGSPGGLALLRIDANAIGGSKAFAFVPFVPGTTAKTDVACRDAAFDAWVENKRYPAAPPMPADTKSPIGEGARVIGRVQKDRPFAVLELPKEECVVATSDERSDKLTLRMRGGATPIAAASGAFGWCSSSDAVAVVEREGSGTVTVSSVPATRVGGSAGLSEVLRGAGISVDTWALPPGDHAWNARQLLVASSVPEGVINVASAPEIAPDRDARIVAFSFGSPNALVADPAADVYSFCEPPLLEKTTEGVCAFSGPQTWKITSAEAVGGVARSKLPFWLFAFEGVSEPAALKLETALVTLARKLRREGFEPTTIDAITETPNGAEVLGRSGEDAVIAIGLAPAEPWVFPYTDGPAWKIDGAPRIVPLKPLEKVKLVSTSRALPSKDTRRTVVFRRQSAKK